MNTGTMVQLENLYKALLKWMTATATARGIDTTVDPDSLLTIKQSKRALAALGVYKVNYGNSLHILMIQECMTLWITNTLIV